MKYLPYITSLTISILSAIVVLISGRGLHPGIEQFTVLNKLRDAQDNMLLSNSERESLVSYIELIQERGFEWAIFVLLFVLMVICVYAFIVKTGTLN